MLDSNFLNYVGNAHQLYGVRRCTLNDGFADGVRTIEVDTGGGFSYTVVESRALDISRAFFRGTNLTYLSPGGEVHPAYYNRDGAEWMRSFFGGLLTTCGPYNIGKASTGPDGVFGLHDRFSNTPSKNICITEGPSCIRISGEIDFGALGFDKLRVHRTIESPLFSPSLKLTDRVTNYGFRDTPFTLLYHTNYGYPLLCEHTRVHFHALQTEYYDQYSRENADSIHRFEAPDPKLEERNYFHRLKKENSYSRVAVVNPALDHLGVMIRYQSDTMPWLTHCKVANPTDYLLAIEPCNAMCIGRDALTERGLLPVLKAGESQEFSIEFSVSQGLETEKLILTHFTE